MLLKKLIDERYAECFDCIAVADEMKPTLEELSMSLIVCSSESDATPFLLSCRDAAIETTAEARRSKVGEHQKRGSTAAEPKVAAPPFSLDAVVKILRSNGDEVSVISGCTKYSREYDCYNVACNQLNQKRKCLHHSIEARFHKSNNCVPRVTLVDGGMRWQVKYHCYDDDCKEQYADRIVGYIACSRRRRSCREQRRWCASANISGA